VHRIVVVGCGIAGIVIATHLSRRLTRSKTADVLLIDHNRAHVWKPMLHTFAAGTANYANENVSFVSQAKRSGFKYWPGELAGLNRRGKLVDLGPVASKQRHGAAGEWQAGVDSRSTAHARRHSGTHRPAPAQPCS
jgi:NADH:ubiquinone reductase (H+-translocating)